MESYSIESGEWMRGNGQKLEYRKFNLNIILYCCEMKHCDRLPREVMEFLSMEIIKTQLATILSNLLELTLLCLQGLD